MGAFPSGVIVPLFSVQIDLITLLPGCVRLYIQDCAVICKKCVNQFGWIVGCELAIFLKKRYFSNLYLY